MEEFIIVIFLGIVEGITEFLPISSTGHLLIFSGLLQSNVAERLGGTFEIFIQMGAVVAVLSYYRDDIIHQAQSVWHQQATQQLWINIVIASIPAGVLGFLLRDMVKNVLFSPSVVAVALITGGVVFILVERSLQGQELETTALEDISHLQALKIGLAQTLALIPGVSRSGASIIGGLLVNINRPTATAFSFYLAIPILGGATILDLLLSLREIRADDFAYLILGTIVSGLVAWFSIKWLLQYVQNHQFVAFGYYRIIAGIIVLLLVALDKL